MKSVLLFIRIKRILGFVLLILSSIGCNKFVQVDPPVTRLATSGVFSNAAAATSAQLAIYNQMFSPYTESYNMSQRCGLLSDELTNYSTTTSQIQYYSNSMLATGTQTGCWGSAYQNYIYQANSIIENLQNNGNIIASIAAQLTGESKFVRAFWHFYLTNQFGDVPIVTTTDYRVTSTLRRSPQTQVYQQIIADLNAAQNLLSADYLDATDTAVTKERVRPTKAAAQALLARVYLYINKYDSAESMATSVINNSAYSLCANLSGANSVFLKNSTEAIWQLQTTLPSSYNTYDGSLFILTSTPNTNSGCAISPELLNSFETGDKRKANWIGTFTAGSTPYYYPFKYQIGLLSSQATNLTSIAEYTMVLRLAEQYLIRSEARAQLGNTAGALADLNAIRNRAGLTNYAGATDKTSLLAAILHERQVELFCEWGHRWYDLIRTNTIGLVMDNPGNVYTYKGGIGAWNNTKELFPIPLSEITNDPNIVQNPGY